MLLRAVVADFHVLYAPNAPFHAAARKRTSYEAMPDPVSVPAHATEMRVDAAVLCVVTGVTIRTEVGALTSGAATVVVFRSAAARIRAIAMGVRCDLATGAAATGVEAGTSPRSVVAPTKLTSTEIQRRTATRYLVGRFGSKTVLSVEGIGRKLRAVRVRAQHEPVLVSRAEGGVVPAGAVAVRAVDGSAVAHVDRAGAVVGDGASVVGLDADERRVPTRLPGAASCQVISQ